ncbi:DUF6477 family protein [Litorisediminicola beolgyonensis]|uniref:DUF6477 family protein n=1 Tax=Litorisediminicola beolgyonensis TaxID=1173614 RepID=A0ABW3ZE96_9RHOB
MTDLARHLASLRRPRLLIRAARIGADEYRRAVHLPRALRSAGLPGTPEALARLTEIEAALDDARRLGCASYTVSRHVEVLAAMMGEARLIKARAERPALAA